MLFSQQHNNVNLAIDTQAEKSPGRTDSLPACLIENSAAGGAGITGGIQYFIGPLVFDHDDDEFEMHVVTSAYGLILIALSVVCYAGHANRPVVHRPLPP